MSQSPFSGQNRARGITVVIVTFILATAVTAQLKSSLIPGSNTVARDQQLVDSAQQLDRDNQSLRDQIKSLEDQIKALNDRLAGTSGQAQQLQSQAVDEKDRTGLSAVSGPGITVDLSNGNDPHIPGDNKRDWQVKYLDIQDVVNLLWSAGAESVSVNNQRVIASSSFYVAGTDVLLNGAHLTAPYHVQAIGDGNAFNRALSDNGKLQELKSRSELYQLKLTWQTQRNLSLPAYDGAVNTRYASAG
ncbi:MAG: DUF881 domain-containing protein [Candidatus Dormiibacterota bacterium]